MLDSVDQLAKLMQVLGGQMDSGDIAELWREHAGEAIEHSEPMMMSVRIGYAIMACKGDWSEGNVMKAFDEMEKLIREQYERKFLDVGSPAETKFARVHPVIGPLYLKWLRTRDAEADAPKEETAPPPKEEPGVAELADVKKTAFEALAILSGLRISTEEAFKVEAVVKRLASIVGVDLTVHRIPVG